MRFAITCSDRYLAVFEAFVAAGWEPIRLFTVPTDGRLFRNSAVIERARALKMGILLSRLGERELRQLQDDGCDVLVVASYQWRIGDWAPFVPHAINFHPSLLPQYRGSYPLLNGLLAQCQRWGVSCHKLAPEFDSGDVLAQQEFEVAPDETHETLDLRTQIAAGRLAARVAAEFADLWAGATPQAAGTHAPLLGDAARTIDFDHTVEQILRQVRAFGRFECLARVNGVMVHVARAAGWREPHQELVGTVVHAYALAVVVACHDGYIALLDWHLFSPAAVSGTPAR